MKLKPKIAHYLILLLFVFSFLFNLELNAQEVKITWGQLPVIKENISPEHDSPEWVSYFYFDGASYPDVQNMLPHYYEILPNSNYDAGSIQISDVVYDTISFSDFLDTKGIHKLDTSITISTKLLYDRKQTKLSYSFIPMVKKKDHLLLVQSFQLQYNSLPELKSMIVPVTGEQKQLTSPLKSGEWYKIRLKKTGIYKITFDELINLGISNPSNVRVYGNVGGQLPFNTNEPRVQGLQENPVYVHTGSDGAFNSGDYLLFYGQGPDRWKYSEFDEMFVHKIHDYSENAYYFLTSDLGKGKRIDTADDVSGTPEITFQDYIYGLFHEENNKNLTASGRQWFETLPTNQLDVPFRVPDIVTSRDMKMKARVVGRSKGSSSFNVYFDDMMIGDIGISAVNLGSHESDYARAGTVKKNVSPSSDDFQIRVRYNRQTNEDKGYLDYIMVNAYRRLKINDEPLLFRQFLSNEKLARFEVLGASENTIIWDVTDPHAATRVDHSYTGGVLNFSVHMNSVKEFIAFNLSHNFLKPEFMEDPVPNQDLTGMEPVNYIIVTHPDFIDQANELAKIHRDKSQLTVAVVTPQQIYNEFSSGAPDVSAIRDFFKWVYDKDDPSNPIFKYALLFGDGTYDNKNKDASSNFILTYQSNESLHQTRSFVADDFFTFLDPNEGDVGGTMDIGIGRFPVQSEAQAIAIIDKIKKYLDSGTMKPWRNRLCFIGDDEDNNIHMDQADRLTRKMNANHPEFQIHKVYLDAYRQQVSANGTSYPEVEKNIFDALENGTLVFNYTGHGSENGLAHERIILKGDIQNWKNAPYFPLFITATCEFSRFDNNDKTTAGEWVLLNPDGGGIALLTTTRLVYSSDNFTLNNNFYDYVFQQDEEGRKYRFGDILRLSKNSMQGTNKRNFTLLGDPALALNYPLHKVYTDSINEIPVTERADTISAFSRVTISGFVGDSDGNRYDGFNGSVYPVIMDKQQEITTLNNDGKGTYTFKVRNNAIYKGEASVKDGRFSFSFMVPKDIGYSIGQGKIIYYAENQSVDAHGYDTAIYIGGTPDQLIVDDTGPSIKLFLNDSNFVNGGITDANPKLFATVADESGINATGAGIGHDIVAYLNGNTSEVFVLNEYYETLQDKFTAGTITYPLQNLETGWHTLTLKVWDIINNSSEQTIEFQVLGDADPVIENVFNYPNPFMSTTRFNVEHNMSDQQLQVIIEIFDLSGRVIRRIENNLFAGGYRLEPIIWDGTNAQGERLEGGIYPYRVTLENEIGDSVQKFSKLILQ